MVSSVGVSRRLLVAIVLGFGCVGICLLISGTATTLTVSVRSTPHAHEIATEKHLVYDPQFHFSYDYNYNYMMSKRKVPNGPDPIHNRRAGNSKRPPGNV